MAFRIEFDKKQLNDAFLKVFRQRLDKLGYLIVNEIQDNIRNLGLVKTGALMGRINHKVEGNSLFIMDGTKYGVFLEFGTTDHMVFPKTKKALKWKDKKSGKDAFSKGHFVRGIKAYGFFRKTLFNPTKMRELIGKAFK